MAAAAAAVFAAEAEGKGVTMKTSSSTSSVFETGRVRVSYVHVDPTNIAAPPKPVLIITPTVQGTYPVLLFLHGYDLRNAFYSQMLHHIATHGYIVVAPQLYVFFAPSGIKEIRSAAAVTNWVSSSSFQSVLPDKVIPDLDKLAISGHSRGGKAAFAVALGYAQTSRKFAALVGLDPVAGKSRSKQTDPKILTFLPSSFDLTIPVCVIGTGLGDEQRDCLKCPCAPNGVNHAEFYSESKAPCSHFVTTDYGHMDVLNDHPPGFLGARSGAVCKNGSGPRDPMRKTVSGLFVAFLNAYLNSDTADYLAILSDPSLAPVKLDPVEFSASS